MSLNPAQVILVPLPSQARNGLASLRFKGTANSVKSSGLGIHGCDAQKACQSQSPQKGAVTQQRMAALGVGAAGVWGAT